jgi:hypothetical protein
VAIERYYAVTRPISAFVDDGHGKWKKVIAFIAPVLVFSVIFNIPTFFEFRVEIINTPPASCANTEVEKQKPFVRLGMYYIKYLVLNKMASFLFLPYQTAFGIIIPFYF